MLKIKMVASPGNLLLIVGDKMLALRRSVFLPETHDLDSDILTVDADAVLTAVLCGLAVSPMKPQVPPCEEQPEPHTPGGTKTVLRVGGEPR